MNKNLYFKNFGKIFLIMGAVFAVTGIGRASAQAIEVRCIKAGTGLPNHKHGNLATNYGVTSSSDYTNWRVCSEWALFIGGEHIKDLGKLRAHTHTNIDANTIINNASPSTFKAKIISSIPNGDQQFKAKMLSAIPDADQQFKAKMLSAIPDADQQFKAKVMTLLPLPELAKYYDPNRIFE